MKQTVEAKTSGKSNVGSPSRTFSPQIWRFGAYCALKRCNPLSVFINGTAKNVGKFNKRNKINSLIKNMTSWVEQNMS